MGCRGWFSFGIGETSDFQSNSRRSPAPSVYPNPAGRQLNATVIPCGRIFGLISRTSAAAFSGRDPAAKSQREIRRSEGVLLQLSCHQL